MANLPGILRVKVLTHAVVIFPYKRLGSTAPGLVCYYTIGDVAPCYAVYTVNTSANHADAVPFYLLIACFLLSM